MQEEAANRKNRQITHFHTRTKKTNVNSQKFFLIMDQGESAKKCLYMYLHIFCKRISYLDSESSWHLEAKLSTTSKKDGQHKNKFSLYSSKLLGNTTKRMFILLKLVDNTVKRTYSNFQACSHLLKYMSFRTKFNKVRKENLQRKTQNLSKKIHTCSISNVSRFNLPPPPPPPNL